MKCLYGIFFICVCIWCPCVDAMSVNDLNPEQEWRLQRLTVEGNEHFSTDQLRKEIVTKPRPWYFPWRPHPPFDPVTFTTDIERLVRFYRAQGYYHAQVTYDLERQKDDHLIIAHIMI